MTEPNGNEGRKRRQLSPDLEQGPPGFLIYRGAIPLMELPCADDATSDDYLWAFHNGDLHRQYQGLVVAIRDRQVWGVGKDGNAAWDDARRKPDCPAMHELAFVHLVGLPGPAGDEARSPSK